MSGFTVSGPQVIFCKEYRCNSHQVAKAAENTTMTITSLAGTKYLGCGKYVAYPKGHIYCECCYSWKSLDITNRAWVLHKCGDLMEDSLVCEDCCKRMSFPSYVSVPLCGTFHASTIKPKSVSIVKRLCKWLGKKDTPQYDPNYLWD